MTATELARAFRQALKNRDSQVTRDLIKRYGDAWKTVVSEAQRFARMLEAEAARTGKTLAQVAKDNPSWPFQQARLEGFSRRVALALRDALDGVPELIAEGQTDAVLMALDHAERLALQDVLDKTPKGKGAVVTAALAEVWDRPNLDAFNALIGNVADGSPLSELLSRYGSEGAERLRAELLRGFILGENPRAIALRMRSVMGGEMAKALTLARTEIIRAYRQAAAESYGANGNVITGWTWQASLDSRCCLGCISKHGSVHAADEVLSDHPNGRCVQKPNTKPWGELADELGLPELADLKDPVRPVQEGADWLAGLSSSKQLETLGATRYAMFQDGVSLDEMVTERIDRTWGASIGPKPLTEIVTRDQLARYQEQGASV